MTTVVMITPSTFGGSVSGTPSGTVYAPGPSATVTVQQEDVATLAALGFVAEVSVGFMNLPLTSALSAAGVPITATPTGGAFGVTQTLGTSTVLKTEAAKSSTVTDVASFGVTLPASFPAGEDLTLTATAILVPGASTVTTKTVDASAYLMASDGTSSADLVTTAAQTISASSGDYSFTIAGDTLTPGAVLMVSTTMVITETVNAAAAYGNLTGLKISA